MCCSSGPVINTHGLVNNGGEYAGDDGVRAVALTL